MTALDPPTSRSHLSAAADRSVIAPYNFSFMGLSLRPELARIVAEIYLTEGDWNRTKERTLSSNALQCRNAKTAARMERELRLRLQTLTLEQLTLLTTAPAEDRTAIAWLAAIKSSPFLFDFAAEVLRDKLETRDPVLRYSDYETFVETRAASHPTLAHLSAASGKKVRQILLHMLTEAGLIRANHQTPSIHRPFLSPPVLETIRADNPRWLAGFLVPDNALGAS